MQRRSVIKSAGAGMAAGVVVGLVAGLFLRSKKGQALQKDAEKRAHLLQKQVMKKLESVDVLTQKTYDEVVDEVLVSYAKSKDVVKSELPMLRTELRKRWKLVKEYVDKRL